MLATRSNQRTKVTREETSCRSLEENEGPIKVLVARLLEDSINVNVACTMVFPVFDTGQIKERSR